MSGVIDKHGQWEHCYANTFVKLEKLVYFLAGQYCSWKCIVKHKVHQTTVEVRMRHVDKVAVVRALQKAFCERQYFNLSGVTEACEVLGRPIYEQNVDWATMKALHCVDWSDIDPQAKRELMEIVGRALGVEAGDVEPLAIGFHAVNPTIARIVS